MKDIGIASIALAALLSAAPAHAQTPEGPQPDQPSTQSDRPSTQPRTNPSETMGSGTRSRLGPTNIVPPDGATDRAPPSKTQPGELPPPQNPKQ
jgi:hypothetical protein